MPYVSTRAHLSRRQFLRGAGVALSLPLLDSMLPAFARAAAASSSPLAPRAKPRRLVAICNNLGLLPDLFFPTAAGHGYPLSPYLKVLEAHRRDFTVFSGVSHPNVDGQHSADVSFLTAAPHPGSGSFRNSISLDQVVAEQIGAATRFPSLVLAVNSRTRTLSFTGAGVALPPEESAAEVFRQMFVQGSPTEVEAQLQRLDTGRSILDAVSSQARRLGRAVGPRDRERLDQYFTSVRELESRLQASKGWERRPKPPAPGPAPVDPESPAAYMEKVKIIYHVIRLALETDSTRAITLMLNSVDSPVLEIPGVELTGDYHDLSHHGKSEAKRAQLEVIDKLHMQLLGELVAGLKSVREEGDTVLDRTMLYYGSHFGDANTHVTTNMPALLFGGGFRHGQHLAFDPLNNYPLPNLYVSMLQRLGLPADKFASSTGTMRGLEMT